jgi:hypothetical protein
VWVSRAKNFIKYSTYVDHKDWQAHNTFLRKAKADADYEYFVAKGENSTLKHTYFRTEPDGYFALTP